MKAILKLVTVCVAALYFSAGACQADVIYSSLGPDDMFGAGPLILGTTADSYLGSTSGTSVQVLFQSSGTYSVSSFTLAMHFYTALGLPVSPLFNAYLYSNEEGYQPLPKKGPINLPNAVIAEIGQAL